MNNYLYSKINQVLVPLGFKKKGANWFKDIGDKLKLKVYLQKSRWSNSYDIYFYALNPIKERSISPVHFIFGALWINKNLLGFDNKSEAEINSGIDEAAKYVDVTITPIVKDLNKLEDLPNVLAKYKNLFVDSDHEKGIDSKTLQFFDLY